MKRWQRIALLVIGGLLGLYVLWGVSHFATARPAACAACHIIQPYVASWRESPHRSVECLYCHTRRGFPGKVAADLRGARDLHLYVTGQWTHPTRGKVTEENCIGCHLGDWRGFEEAPRLDKRHEAYVRADRRCLACHREPGHRVNLFPGGKYQGARSTQAR